MNHMGKTTAALSAKKVFRIQNLESEMKGNN
jgi:hypothetical protein